MKVRWIGLAALATGVLFSAYPSCGFWTALGVALAGLGLLTNASGNALGRLRTLGLIEGRGELRASEHLF